MTVEKLVEMTQLIYNLYQPVGMHCKVDPFSQVSLENAYELFTSRTTVYMLLFVAVVSSIV